VLTLQIIVIIALAFCAGVGYWAHNFTQDQVRTQLTEQQIVFPPANSAAIKALPSADASAMTQYAGQQMTNGYQAETWANHFIAVHLKEIGKGKTYAYWSGLSLAHPTNAQYAAITQTLFRGETLRSLLLNAYAFWFVGDLALYAAIGLTIASITVLLSFLFELVVVPRRRAVAKISPSKGAAAVV
jgi:hypothetical protein